jgi:hypothetical protein
MIDNMKNATDDEKTKVKHAERKIYDFSHNEDIVDIYMTKHGHFRILEEKQLSFEKFGDIIKSIGTYELDYHFREAMKAFPLDAREDVDWKTKVDYCLSVYDVVNEMVFMFGLHPHLNRITIVTIIPRIHFVVSNNIFGSYRIDNEWTKNTKIKYTIPPSIKMKFVKIAS